MVSRPIPAYHRSPFSPTINVDVLDAGAGPSGAWVVTADTVIYPGGGGQPADEGTLGGIPVSAVKWTGEGWRHELTAAHPPVDHGQVGIVIDWTRRFDHMQQHTAQHVLTAIAQDRWGWATTAFHLGAERSDIELDTSALSRAQMDALEEAVMTVVRDELPVSTRYVSVDEYKALGTRSRGLPEGHEGDVRLVEIGGPKSAVDVTACGGTHLASTAQIESLKLLATESMRGGTRLHWVAGGRVRARLGAHEARSEELRKLLGAPDEQLVQQATAKLAQLRELEKRARWTEARLADETIARLALTERPVLDAHFDGMDAAFLKSVAQGLQNAIGARIALLTSEADDARAFLLVAGPDASVDVRALGQGVAELLEGRGGGTGRIYQGRAGSLAKRSEALRKLQS
jgi:alanyl-tRNA synthetase